MSIVDFDPARDRVADLIKDQTDRVSRLCKLVANLTVERDDLMRVLSGACGVMVSMGVRFDKDGMVIAAPCACDMDEVQNAEFLRSIKLVFVTAWGLTDVVAEEIREE